MEDLEIVAADGKPTNTVGYMVPVVRCNTECFLLGSQSGFDAYSLDKLAEEHKVVKIDPALPLSEILPFYEYKKTDKKKHLGSEAYIFHRDTVEMEELGISIQKIDGMPNCQKVYFPLEFGYLEVYAVDNLGLKDILKFTFSDAEERLCGLLKKGNSEDYFRTNKVAEVLYQSAHDKSSVRKAIAYRGIAAQGTPREKHYMDFVRFTAKPWKFKTSKKFWNDQIRRLKSSLGI